MKTVLIVGNSGAARECYWLLRAVLEAAPDAGLRFGGFLDWEGHPGSLAELEPLHLGPAAAHPVGADERYVIGVGKPALRRAIYSTLKERGAIFMNLVHPAAFICPSAILGEGNVIQRGFGVSCNAVVGNGNYLNGNGDIGHDAVLGDFNFLAPYVLVLGGARVGSDNHFGPHSVALDHARVGDANLVGPGCVLYRGCGSHCRMAGNPALKIGDAP